MGEEAQVGILPQGAGVFDDLLKAFSLVPPSKQERKPSILEVCGFPHYEQVASNILAFFLESGREHGLDNTMLRALFNCADIELCNCFREFRVFREERTENLKRIDIFLQSGNECCVVIENKIFADPDYNDLNEYMAHARSIVGDKGICIGIFLSLHEQAQKRRNSCYKYITYRQLKSSFESLNEDNTDRLDSKFLLLIEDFFMNMERLTRGESEMNTDFTRFINDNSEELERFFAELARYRSCLEYLVEEVNKEVRDSSIGIPLDQWRWPKTTGLLSVAVSDLNIHADKRQRITIDSIVDCSGWVFEVFTRYDKASLSDLRKRFEECGLVGTITESKVDGKSYRFCLDKKFCLDASFNEVSQFITESISKLMRLIRSDDQAVFPETFLADQVRSEPPPDAD